jgi:quercetin dioxygenase-like cupin family protein
MTTFSDFNSQRPRQIWGGIQARVVNGERITMALVDLAADNQLQEHQHENEQVGFVLQGQLTFTIGGETRTLHAGDTYNIPTGVPHNAVTGPDGCVVVDIFSPVRADWEKHEQHDPSPSAWKMPG